MCVAGRRRRRRPAARSGIGIAIVTTAIVAAGSASRSGSGSASAAAPAEVFHCEVSPANLLRNGDAESGAGVADRHSVAAPPGWVAVSGKMTSVRYGADPLFPGRRSAGPRRRGENFLAGGPTQRVSVIEQTVDLSNLARAINASRARVELRACLGGSGRQNDRAQIDIEFLDRRDRFFAGGRIGGVSSWERHERTGLVPHVLSDLVPPGTVKARVIVTAERGTDATVDRDSYNDGYVDNVSLTVTIGA